MPKGKPGRATYVIDNRLENLELLTASEHRRRHMTSDRARRMRLGLKECSLA